MLSVTGYFGDFAEKEHWHTALFNIGLAFLSVIWEENHKKMILFRQPDGGLPQP